MTNIKFNLGIALEAFNDYKINSNDKYSHFNKSNIFIFSDDTSDGKTSCMLSFLNMLSGKTNSNILDVVSPPFYSNNHSIIELIVGTMFNKLKKSLNQHSFIGTMEDRQLKDELINAFQNVQKSISSGNHNTDYDNIESLLNLSSNVEMKENIFIMIQKYLALFGGDVLVIPIEDLDQNNNCHIILEQLRKNFCFPNVAIILDANITKLNTIINSRSNFYNDRFLDSIIPLSQRF